MDVWEALSYEVPNFRFMPAHRKGTWDGKVRLMNLATQCIPFGLMFWLVDYAEKTGTKLTFDPRLKRAFTKEKYIGLDWFEPFKFWSNGKEITPRADQLEAVDRSLKMNRSTNVCPTSFGKSLCIFMQVLWYMAHDIKPVIIVPTVELVNQLADDFRDYCTKPDGTLETWYPRIHKIFSGQEKYNAEHTDVTITTWQSVYKIADEFLAQYQAVIVDEVHGVRGDCLRDTLGDGHGIWYRTGWTGSLKKAGLDALLVAGAVGPIRQITDTATLMDKGIVAKLKIVVTQFTYNDVDREHVSVLDWQNEVKFLETSNARNNTIVNIIGTLPKNTLCLFVHKAHGTALYEKAMRKYGSSRSVYLIYGNTVLRNGEKRGSITEVKPEIEKDKDAIIFASFGVFSTGISIKNIHFLMFGISVKSYFRVLQSIGRGLRISETKSRVTLIDIVDDLRFKKKRARKDRENFTFKHFKERFGIYSDEKFDYTITSVPVSY